MFTLYYQFVSKISSHDGLIKIVGKSSKKQCELIFVINNKFIPRKGQKT